MDKRDLFTHSIREQCMPDDVETVAQLTVRTDGLILVDVDNNDNYYSWDDVYYALRGRR